MTLVQGLRTDPAGDPRAGDPDRVVIRTVGIDVGSATYHLMISSVRLERRARELSSRFDVVGRDVLWSSPVRLTPYVDGDTIDVAAVEEAVRDGYLLAGVAPGEIDSGAVLLTGTALGRHNARALADRLAGRAGRFVCAAAGHHLEAVLAAHGSGAVELSAGGDGSVVNVDIGGGTTKLALAQGGKVQVTAAVAVGSRLLTWDTGRRLTRVERSVVAVGRQLGIPLGVGSVLTEAAETVVCGVLAAAVVQQLVGPPGPGRSAGDRLLTAPFPAPSGPFAVVLSGGVAEYLDQPPGGRGHGDLGPVLASAVMARLRAAGLADCVRPAAQRIRATVIGASQFSTQVSGSTVRVGDASLLPVHNLPVIRPPLPTGQTLRSDVIAEAFRRAIVARADEIGEGRALALAVGWEGSPEHGRLRALAEGLRDAIRSLDRPPELVVVTVDRDLGASLGRILVEETGADSPTLVCLDNLDLGALDYLDVGRPSLPANVVPVVVKSLLFDADRYSGPLAVDRTPVRGETRGRIDPGGAHA